MTLPSISSYEIKTSKTGLQIPIVDDIHLHSIYDPMKEAEGFIKKNQQILMKNNNILFLGMGFGYHIDLACRILHKFHQGYYSIVVVEPNKKTAEDCFKLKKKKEAGLSAFIGESIESLYLDRSFISFLLKRPSIISHPASFNLYKDYFEQFLTYKSPQSIQEIIKVVSSKEIRDFLEGMESEQTLSEYTKNILMEKNRISHENEFLFLALHHMTDTGLK